SAALASRTAIAGAPRAVRGTAGSDQATLSWSAPASNGGIPLTGYEVTTFVNGVAQSQQVFNSPATSQTLSGLSNGTAYTFTVTALDANGSGPVSDPSEAVIVGTPTKPTGLAATGGGDYRVTF